MLMSDDQDIRLGSMDYMETLQKEMVAKGTSFLNHHTTSAQCCPSRVTLLRGQAAHNTNVTSVFAPGYAKREEHPIDLVHHSSAANYSGGEQW